MLRSPCRAGAYSEVGRLSIDERLSLAAQNSVAALLRALSWIDCANSVNCGLRADALKLSGSSIAILKSSSS